MPLGRWPSLTDLTDFDRILRSCPLKIFFVSIFSVRVADSVGILPSMNLSTMIPLAMTAIGIAGINMSFTRVSLALNIGVVCLLPREETN